MIIFSKDLTYKKRSLLPKEYQQVEYIQSTGTQYINTGVKPTVNTKGYFKQTFDTSSMADHEGFYSSGYKDMFALGYANDNNTYYYHYYYGNYNNGEPGVITPIVVDNNPHEFLLYNGYQSLDGIQYSTNNNNLTANYDIYLFASFYEWNQRPQNATIKSKLYLCKFWESNQLTRNFIPCYRKSDDVIGLYDLANKEFYTNNGTGTFMKGPDVI